MLTAVHQQTRDIPQLESLAQAAAESGRIDQAISLAETIIGLQPGHAEAYNFLGTMLARRRQTVDAFHAYSRALALDRLNFRAFSNIAMALNDIDKFDAAVSSASAAIEIAPEFDDAYMNLASIYASRGHLEKAATAYLRLLAVKPDASGALIEVHFILMLLCDWDRLAPVKEKMRSQSISLKDPRQVWSFSTAPATHQEASRMWAANLNLKDEAPLATYEPRPAAHRCQALRIGYLSADLKYHATAMLIVELLEMHDRSRFETFGYSISIDDGTPLRRRIESSFDHFVDLNPLSDADAAQRIRTDEIDILIDLMGYTKLARTGIVARRPAPIQVNFLGFPGTMGAGFIDYVIADHIVIPKGADAFYDEKVVRLPFCYQPNDRKRQITSRQPTRADCGLPGSAFVFCCFNSTYKITEEVFDIWMRLLARVPHAVLWLLEDSESACANLRSQATRRGIVAERVIFGSRLLNADHLARLRLADLFLDTLPVTAHTTASDAMWAGLPLLTCLDKAFVSRVAASILQAVGLPELIAENLADYERKAFHYARKPDELSELRDRLQCSRETSTLFDTPRYARDFEAALARMGELRDAGQPPVAFAIPG